MCRQNKRARLALRDGFGQPSFRGIPWALLVRHRARLPKKSAPAKLHAFRLRDDDQLLLERLARELNLSRTDVIRAGLRKLAMG